MAKKKLSIELVGIGKTLDISAIKVEPCLGASFLFIEAVRGDTWRFVATSDLVPKLKELNRIDVIRNGEWKGLGFSHKARTQVIELGVYPALHFNPEDESFQLEKMKDGKWRMDCSSELIPDFAKLESFTFHYSEE
mgnify:CR=1 FL=1